MRCANCGAEVRPAARFCATCGTATVAAVPPPGVPPAGAQLGPRSLQGSLGHEIAVVTAGPAPRRRGKLVAAVVAGLAALGVLGVVGWMFFLSDSSGAGSPEAAVEQLVDAVNSGDSLAIVNAFAPSETEGVVAAAERLLTSLAVEPHGPHFEAAVTLRDVEVVESGGDAALVAVRATVTNDIDWPAGLADGDIDPSDFDTDDLLDVLADTYVDGRRVDIDDVTVAVVREDGGWYVSPVLTFGDYVTKLTHAPGADWDAASELPKATADSPSDALEQLVDAAIDLDVVEIASNSDLAIARAAMVFEDAIDDLFDDARGDFTADVDLRLTEVNGGVQVDRVDVEASDGYDSGWARFDDWCVEDDSGSESCLRASWLELPEAPIIATSAERGGHVVDAAATLSWVGDQLAANLDRATLLYALGLEQFAEGTPIRVDQTLQVRFGGDPFVALDLAVEEGQQVIAALDGVETHRRYFRESADEPWREVWSGRFDSAGTLRFVLTPDDDCYGTCLDWDLDAEGTFTANAATVQDWKYPNGLAGELNPYDAFVFRFETDTWQEFELELPDGFEAFVEADDSSGAVITRRTGSDDAASPYLYGSAEPGWNRLWIVNRNDARAPFEFIPQVLSVP